MKVKEESEKAGLKLNIQKTKIMASGAITSWQIDGETVETMWDFIFLGSKITADGDCNHDFKRCLLLGRKVMTNLDSILKSRDITLPTKVYLVKAMIFSSSHIWMWELDHKEGWALKNWCFWTWCWRSLLRVPWTARSNPKGNQPWIFIWRTDAEPEAPILWPPDLKSRIMGKAPDAGKDWGQEETGDDRGWDGWMASPTEWRTWVCVDSGSWWWTGRPGMLSSWGRKELDTTEQQNWTELNMWIWELD